ncbi:acylphosphatase [Reichenbachiella agarivorans]|uniref:Acylphosphatase n=1 Tax=Reichenbachiella agarivorans TaxID=2979464 RepID=A0ABY6CPK6_9BACT|nr:acylphosphatase [Reichenbachiella agarivorans]UXP32452.1 acylphosphatase [Reichenbachiella agarivorans]
MIRPKMKDKIGKSIIIKGKVQGVFFRASAFETAERLGVQGWVRNQPDGSVAMEVYGPVSAVAAMVVWCGEGSEFSKVKEVQAEDLPYSEVYNSFNILY